MDGYFCVLAFFFPPMLLAFVNNVAMNLGIQYLFKALLLFFFLEGGDPEVELLNYVLILFFIFGGTTMLFSIIAAPFYLPTNNAYKFHFHHLLWTVEDSLDSEDSPWTQLNLQSLAANIY